MQVAWVEVAERVNETARTMSNGNPTIAFFMFLQIYFEARE
jgi:hypothetical protein